MRIRHLSRLCLLSGILLIASACGSDAPTSSGELRGSVFEVRVGNESFRVQATSAPTISAMRARMQSGTLGVLIGSLSAGDGGVNAPYGWHLDPETVAVADVAVEVCDGRPSDVQGNLSYWLGTVRSYCPWGARIVRELP